MLRFNWGGIKQNRIKFKRHNILLNGKNIMEVIITRGNVWGVRRTSRQWRKDY